MGEKSTGEGGHLEEKGHVTPGRIAYLISWPKPTYDSTRRKENHGTVALKGTGELLENVWLGSTPERRKGNMIGGNYDR